METDVLSVARWQFRLAWGLAEVHLARLTDEGCLWRPHPTSWTVRESDAGRWIADSGDEAEPVDPAPPSIGWLTWHILWWWTDALAVVEGREPGVRVGWPGTAGGVIDELGRLAAAWDAATRGLSAADLRRGTAFPWPAERPLIYTVAWVPLELMKNVAEIGEVLNMYNHRQ